MSPANPIAAYYSTIAIPADARGAFHPPPAADGTVGGWLARFEESRSKSVRTGEHLDVAAEERDGQNGGENAAGGRDYDDAPKKIFARFFRLKKIA